MSDGFIDRTVVVPITLDDAHGSWQYEPQADISAYEAALINSLFIAMLLRKSRLDWREYLTRERPIAKANGHDPVLADPSRHFKEL